MGVNAWRRNGRGRACLPLNTVLIHGTLHVVLVIVGEGLAPPGFPASRGSANGRKRLAAKRTRAGLLIP